MPTSEHEDDEAEELYGIIEEILEEDGKMCRHCLGQISTMNTTY
jgi:hypothetical protein